VAWALRTGGPDVRAAVAAVFAEIGDPPIALATSSEATAACPALIAHGRLSRAELEATLERGLREVVLPSTRALLAIGEAASLAS
jgi:hypothetical protein